MDSSVFFLCFVQVRSTYSVPDTPLRASNRGASHNCKSVNDLTCIQTQTGQFLDLTFNVLLHFPPRLSSAGDPNRKWQTEDTTTLQTVPSPPPSAARVRPLLRQRRHRLVRLEDCTALGSKVKMVSELT